MCNCSADKNDGTTTNNATVTRNVEFTSQDDAGQRPQRGKCCKVRRVLTYEDETCVDSPSPGTAVCPLQESIQPAPLATPLPAAPCTPALPATPGLRRGELAGVAIIRRRIELDAAAPEQQPEEKKEDDPEANKDKETEDKDVAAEAKESEGENPVKENGNGEKDKADGQASATSTPCPGQLNPQSNCTCSAIPKK